MDDMEDIKNLLRKIHADIENVAFELHIANDLKMQEMMDWKKHEPRLYKLLSKQIEERIDYTEKLEEKIEKIEKYTGENKLCE